jgi:hypothetical protein
MKINFKPYKGATIAHNFSKTTSTGQVPDVALEFMQVMVGPQVDTYIANATEIAEETANILIENFFNWIGHNFMGEDASPWNLGVTWAPLSKDYVKMKAHSGYWLYTGRLRRQFYSKSGLKAFGPVKASSGNGTLDVIDRSVSQAGGARYRTVNGKSIKIVLFPKLQAFFRTKTTVLSGAEYGPDVENMLLRIGAIDAEMLRKLEGRHEYYRALLGPALAKYASAIIPNAIRQALSLAGYKNDTRRRAGLNDEGGYSVST